MLNSHYCAIGVTVISNEVEAVRGIANNGPIVRYMIIKRLTKIVVIFY